MAKESPNRFSWLILKWVFDQVTACQNIHKTTSRPFKEHKEWPSVLQVGRRRSACSCCRNHTRSASVAAPALTRSSTQTHCCASPWLLLPGSLSDSALSGCCPDVAPCWPLLLPAGARSCCGCWAAGGLLGPSSAAALSPPPLLLAWPLLVAADALLLGAPGRWSLPLSFCLQPLKSNNISGLYSSA